MKPLQVQHLFCIDTLICKYFLNIHLLIKTTVQQRKIGATQVIILMFLSWNCLAGVEYRKFEDPQKEQAYHHLISELRCLVCQNQTIADSNADLAKDLRRQVYEMLQQGKSQNEIIAFMTQRYGDFVLYNPPFKAKTSLLWLGPVLFLLIGLATLLLFIRRGKTSDTTTQPDAEQQAIKSKAKTLLDDGDQS